jgi:uncharacterized Zn-binding protein involved in type VI secretion
MGKPAAKMGDKVIGTDTHIVMVPTAGGPVATPTPFDFNGTITSNCCTTVLISGKPAAVQGSIARNIPPHIPKSGTFQKPPTNQANIVSGSPTVLIGGKSAARAGDKAMTCNDPLPLPVGTVQATGTVLIGP